MKLAFGNLWMEVVSYIILLDILIIERFECPWYFIAIDTCAKSSRSLISLTGNSSVFTSNISFYSKIVLFDHQCATCAVFYQNFNDTVTGVLVSQFEVSEFFLLVALKFYFSFSSQVNPRTVNTACKKSFHHVLYKICCRHFFPTRTDVDKNVHS